MNLPTGSLDSLKALRAQLDKMNNTLGSNLTEL
jgi:hypothetical protein